MYDNPWHATRPPARGLEGEDRRLRRRLFRDRGTDRRQRPLLTGVSGGEFGVVGRVEARDARSGRVLWSRPMVEGHMGYTCDADGNNKENGISGTVNKSRPGN